MKFLLKFILLFTPVVFTVQRNLAQNNTAADTAAKFKLISAGPQYKRSAWHQYLWGKNYRKEWSTPVKLPVFLLNDHEGGLTPEKEGGGHQTSSLHLKAANGEDYTLRSVDKKLGKVLPKIFLGTWIEHLVNDEVSMSNPYAAITVPGMATSAGIYHTTPQFVYLPKQAALDSFNEKYGNKVYLFEQRIKGDWSSANNLGNFKKFYSTEEVMDKMHDKSKNQADQAAFAKDRLFDMFLGDWDRHEEQWSWGEVEKADHKIFEPVPQDRDQVFFKHNGLLLDAAIYGSGIRYFQSFKNHISDVNTMAYEERGLDRVFTNELKKSDWETAARELQTALTNEVIETAIKNFPPEIYKISGKLIASDLEARRDHLLQYARKYYLFLSKAVEITGTTGSDYFSIKRLNDSTTQVDVYNINKEGIKDDEAWYSRSFYASETNEIRLYGLSGNDVYTSDGDAEKGITLRIIGGYDKDSIVINSKAGHDAKTIVYDGHDDYIQGSGIKKHLSSDSSIHAYQYKNYMYDNHFSYTRVLYSEEDRIYVGLGYFWKHFAWRKPPFVSSQNIAVHYSITQNAFSIGYFGIFPNTIGKWNLSVLANYDFIRWTNFYGLGNETKITTKEDLDFNRTRSRQANGALSLYRKAGNNFFRLTGFIQSVKIVNDEGRYIVKNVAPVDSAVFKLKTFAGAYAVYGFSKLNDAIVPTAGIAFSANGSYTQNVNTNSQSFWKYGGNLQLYVPLVNKFSLAVSGGIETVDGNPEFYQYPLIGGGQDVRGFQKQRFYGKTAFYNSNELRFISDIRNYLYNGKAGLFAFVDDGRVWMPGEKSNTLHVGYGGGIIVAPFNFIFAEVTYGISSEDQLIQFRINMPL